MGKIELDFEFGRLKLKLKVKWRWVLTNNIRNIAAPFLGIYNKASHGRS